MTIILPTGDVIDTAGSYLKFDSGAVDFKLNGSTVYTPATAAEWYALQRQIIDRIAGGAALLNLAPAVFPQVAQANPDAVVHDAGTTITITGSNFQQGAIWGINYPGLGTNGWVQVDILSFSPTEVTLAMPILPASGSTPVITVSNPDGSTTNFEMLSAT